MFFNLDRLALQCQMIYFWALDIFKIAIGPAQLVYCHHHHHHNRLILDIIFYHRNVRLSYDKDCINMAEYEPS